MSLLPSSPDVSPDGDPRMVGLDSEEADDLMAALSSETARRLLAELHEEPAPPGELADRVDTSLQNAQYHLERLEDAGAVTVAGTAYSEKGREMNVYGPADSPLVIYAGEKERASGLRAALSRLFGGFLALAVGAFAIQELFGRSLLRATQDGASPTAAPGTPSPTPTPESGDGGAGGFDTSGGTATPEAADTPAATGTPTPQATGTPTQTPGDAGGVTAQSAETATEAAAHSTPTAGGGGGGFDQLDAVFDALFGSGLPPGLAFFLGGATVLTVLVAVSYVRTRP